MFTSIEFEFEFELVFLDINKDDKSKKKDKWPATIAIKEQQCIYSTLLIQNLFLICPKIT